MQRTRAVRSDADCGSVYTTTVGTVSVHGAAQLPSGLNDVHRLCACAGLASHGSPAEPFQYRVKPLCPLWSGVSTWATSTRSWYDGCGFSSNARLLPFRPVLSNGPYSPLFFGWVRMYWLP